MKDCFIAGNVQTETAGLPERKRSTESQKENVKEDLVGCSLNFFLPWRC